MLLSSIVKYNKHIVIILHFQCWIRIWTVLQTIFSDITWIHWSKINNIFKLCCETLNPILVVNVFERVKGWGIVTPLINSFTYLKQYYSQFTFFVQMDVAVIFIKFLEMIIIAKILLQTTNISNSVQIN